MGFDAGWLDLREPADAAARDPSLLAAVRGLLAAGSGPVVLDLGAGTGATARAVAVPGVRWRLVDRDPALLALARQRVAGAEAVLADLAEVERLPLGGVRLVTASALLDLAGADWLDALAARLAMAGTGFYAALSYDGTFEIEPGHPADREVRAAFNRHQRGAKGLGGAALGPDAVARMAAGLARRGYRVRLAPSRWRLGAGPLLAALVEGIAEATAEAGVEAEAWRQARATATGAAVGHLDLLALAPGERAQSKTTSVSSP